MPNSRQSIKRHRNSIKKQKHNTPVKRSIKTTASQAASLAKDKKKEESLNLLNSIYSKIDKAVKNGILHKKNAARKKSRIAKALHAVLAK